MSASAWRLTDDGPVPESGPEQPVRSGSTARRMLVVAAIVVLSLVGAGGFAVAGGAAALLPERPEGCDQPDRSVQLYAVELPRDGNQIRLGYGLTPETASYPGPTMEMIEGECLAVTLHNQVPAETLEQLRTDPTHPLGVSLHVHGVKYTQLSDGTAQSFSYVPPGQSRTYTWYAKKRDRTAGTAGTAGYWWYHDHVVGGPHGTKGIGSGLFGGLVVRRPGDLRPDRTYMTVFGDQQSINLRRGAAADTCDQENPQPGPTCIVAKKGERVEFIVVGIGNDMHTFHIHGHSWADTRTGVATGTNAEVDQIPTVDNKTLGPGDSFGVQIVAGDSVGPGHWMIHCHMQFHSDAGMYTTMHVLDENGNMPPGGDHDHSATSSGATSTSSGAAPAGSGATVHQHK